MGSGRTPNGTPVPERDVRVAAQHHMVAEHVFFLTPPAATTRVTGDDPRTDQDHDSCTTVTTPTAKQTGARIRC